MKKIFGLFLILSLMPAAVIAAPSKAWLGIFYSSTQGRSDAPPVNTTAPSATGDVYESGILSCGVGIWTGFPTPTFSYQWQQNSVDISGETSATITLSATEANDALSGQTIKCVVTATNSEGSGSANSNSLSAFTPADVGAVISWYDANDAATITSSAGATSQWSDKSGNSYNATQGSSANKPITGTRTINSRNILDFDGSNDLLIASAAALGTTSPAMTIFAVYLPDNTTTNLYVFSTNNDDLETTKVGNQSQKIGGSSATRSSPVSGSGIIHVTRRQSAPGIKTNRMKINTDAEVTATAGDSSTTAATATWIGSYLIGGSLYWRAFDGGIAEIIVFSGELSNSNVNRVANYLSGKWGISFSNIP